MSLLGKEQWYALLLSTLAGLSTSIGGAAAVSTAGHALLLRPTLCCEFSC